VKEVFSCALGLFESLKGRGDVRVFVVPYQTYPYREVKKYLIKDQVKVYRTISNVLRLPIEFKK